MKKVNLKKYLGTFSAIVCFLVFQNVHADEISTSVEHTICNDSLSLAEQLSTYSPFGPRGFLLGINEHETSAEEMAGMVDAGLSSGYLRWVQSIYIVNKQQIEERMERDQREGIERKEAFFGEFEVRRKILAQITENSGRLTPATAPMVLVSDLTQSDLEQLFKDQKSLELSGNKQEQHNFSSELTANLKSVASQSTLYSANFTKTSPEAVEFAVEVVPKEAVDRFVSLEIFFNEPETEDAKGGYFIMQSSWNDSPFHGSIQMKDWALTPKYIKTMRKVRRKLIENGFIISFNQSNLDQFNYVMSSLWNFATQRWAKFPLTIF